MKIKYQIPTKAYHLVDSDEFEYDYKEVEVEPSCEELSECVATCIFDEYFEKGMYDSRERTELIGFIKEFINEKELTIKLAEGAYFVDVYDYFKKEIQ